MTHGANRNMNVSHLPIVLFLFPVSFFINIRPSYSTERRLPRDARATNERRRKRIQGKITERHKMQHLRPPTACASYRWPYIEITSHRYALASRRFFRWLFPVLLTLRTQVAVSDASVAPFRVNVKQFFPMTACSSCIYFLFLFSPF